MLIGPILAQLVTIGAGASTEARVVIADKAHYEAAARPAVALGLGTDRFSAGIQYSPSFTLTPLESNPQLYLFHAGGLSASYSWRRTTLSVGEFIGYGKQNFRVLATAGNAQPNTGMPTPDPGTGNTGTGSTPNTGTGTPGTGTTGTPAPNMGQNQAPGQRLLDRSVRYGSSSTSAGLSHQLSAANSLVFGLSYSIAGALDAPQRADYPTVKSSAATAGFNQRFDRANGGGVSLALQYSVASNGNRTWLINTGASYRHDFSVSTSSQVGAGLSTGRNWRDDGYVAYSIYPTFAAGLSNVTRLDPGTLTLGFNASSSPALDFQTLVVDPRVGLGAGASWQRERLTTSLGVSTMFSVSGREQSALSNVGGALGVGYQFGAAFSMSAGARMAYQVYQGQTIVPLTYAGFIGASFGLSAPLN